MKIRTENVYINNRLAGTISDTEEGIIFQSSADWLLDPAPLPLSLTMPLRQEPYVSNILFPFFDNLIPEGWLLKTVSEN